MTVIVLAILAIIMTVSTVTLAVVLIRRRKRIKDLNAVIRTTCENISHVRAHGTERIERRSPFAQYDVTGRAPLAHIVCMAVKDLIADAASRGLVCMTTPQVHVDVKKQRVHVALDVMHPVRKSSGGGAA